ncbi:MAG: hypothetical protein J5714_03990 [Alphaproteobacteria bacterium]|nr:hypothetical protein [Alphaproteobacteria bacterium]
MALLRKLLEADKKRKYKKLVRATADYSKKNPFEDEQKKKAKYDKAAARLKKLEQIENKARARRTTVSKGR